MRITTCTPLLSALSMTLLMSSCASGVSTPEDEPPATGAEAQADTAESVDDVAEDSYDLDLSEREPNENVPAELLGEHNYYIQNPDEVSIPLSGETVDHPAYLYVPVEVFPQCDDEQALTSNEGYETSGWPQDWDGEGSMPDPECHPDYIEILEWDHFEAFHACWDGPETSTLGIEGISDEADRRSSLWEMSQRRADWEPKADTCAEQWAENDGGDSDDYSEFGNADDG